jgi:sigma-E factor negative regulatory protein RseA
MNAAQDKKPLNLSEADADSALSALVDGELPDLACDLLLRGVADAGQLHQQWLGYQMIGAALNGRPVVGSVRSSQDFLMGVMAGLPTDIPRELSPAPDARLVHVRSGVANDPVMRWKSVAGVASLAAVMAVSWTVLRETPGTPATASGPVLALNELSPAATVESADSAVVVNTDQGTLIRDARLEQLLAEHRQYGSMSALQMPAGFLRSATHEAAERR